LGAARFIANRITGGGQNKGNISKPIVKIGILGIGIGICVMLLTVSIVLGFKKEIITKITGLTTHIVISSVNMNASNEPEPIHMGADTLKMLRSLPFVKSIQRTAFKNGLLKGSTENEGVLLKGVGRHYNFGFLKEHLIEGRLPVLSDSNMSKEVLISEALTRRVGIKLHDKISLYFISQHNVYDSTAHVHIEKSTQLSRRLIVCGIFKTDFADFDEKLAIVDIRQIQRLNFWDSSMVGNYEVSLHNFNDVDKAVSQIEDVVGYHYNVNSVRDIYANIFVWLDKLDINGVIIMVLMTVVATINMITALLILILERTNMVGLVKALGMSNSSVRRIFLLVSFNLILKGMFWGNLIGIGLCLLQRHFQIASLDSETYYVDHVAIHINWLYFLLVNIGTFLVCTLMLFFPTLIITKLTPVKTLKFD
jgi:lipoprotein-releasing system permease protein